MIHKEELLRKSIEELRQIAVELEINDKGMDQTDLMYAIIDKSASLDAAKRAATPKAKKRTRIKPVDHVYSADQLKAKKIEKPAMAISDNSLFNDLSFEEIEMIEPSKPQTVETPVEEIPAEEKPAVAEEKKKRGRPKKEQKEMVQVAEEPKKEPETKATAETTDEPTSQQPKKKRGRPKKTQEAEEVKETTQPENNDEGFTVIEDLNPVEKKIAKKIVEPINLKEEEPIEQQTEEKPKRSLMSFANPSVQTKVPLQAEEFDDGTDFIILEDIPNEDPSSDYAPISFMQKFKPNTREDSYEQDLNQEQANYSDYNDSDYNEAIEPYDFNNIIIATGVLDVANEGFGFLRSSDYNYLSSPDDIYVNQSQVKHYGLKTGDVVEGAIRPPHEGERYFPLVRIDKINGCEPSVVRDRVPFEYLTPLFPEEKFTLCSGRGDSPTSRIVDLFAPIGKGQRALIVAQPKTGKTLLMKDIANSIARNHPEAYLMMLLIDERPEEVTDMARTVNAEVIASTFDAPADNHVKIANLVLEKAKRMVECGHDVVIFLDSITRLARAYNTVSPASGKVLTGGVDANALQKPKRFFGAARNIEGGGSLTIIATALVDTGSKMDEVIFEEFKGTGNSEIQLDRALANKRMFPAINLVASSTRRDELLQDEQTIRRMWVLRKHIADMTNIESMDKILQHVNRTSDNEEFLLTMNG